ncbi:MAG: hypothetical protein AAGA03_20200, partial [Planctomycetota bacterium]
FTIGVLAGFFDGLVTRPDRLRDVLASDAGIVASTRGGGLSRFDGESKAWSPIFETRAISGDLIVPPTTLGGEQILTARLRRGRVNLFSSGTPDLLVVDASTEWQPQPTIELPQATRQLIPVGNDRLLAVHNAGIVIASRSKLEDEIASVLGERDANNDDESVEDGDLESTDGEEPTGDEPPAVEAPPAFRSNWFSNLLGITGGDDLFQSILPRGVSLGQPNDLAISTSGDWLVLYSQGRIVRLAAPNEDADSVTKDPVWELAVDRNLEGDASVRARLAVSAGRILICRDKESPELLNADSLETLATIESEGLEEIDRVLGLPAGKNGESRFLVLDANAQCVPVTGDQGTLSAGSPLSYSDVESFSYDPPSDRLAIAFAIDKVDLLDPSDFSVQERIRPSLSRWRWVDRYVVTPLRTITPQTGELGDTISALVSGESSISVGPNPDQDEDKMRYKIWRPVLSCATFIGVMLGISCVYFSRRDF